MTAYLSEDWLARLAEVASGWPSTPGATARIQHVVTGGPAGRKAEQAYRLAVADGALRSAELGPAPSEDDVDLVVTEGWDDSLRVLRGEVEPDVLFMQGKRKVVGPMGTYLALFPLLRSDGYRAAQAELAADTDAP